MELPFLYVHGALVWKVLLFLLVAASLAAVAALRSRMARREARREIAALGLTALREGDVVLHAKIVQGSASTLTQELEQSNERTSGLVVMHEGERIVIEGDVKVTHGSHARRWWFRPPHTIDARWCWSHVHAGVVAGDEVIVCGTLSRTSTAASYRERASRWELTGHPVTIAACAPETKALPLGFGRWVAGIALFATIWYGALRFVGSKALDIAAANTDPLTEIASHDALAIAAAMPGTRDRTTYLLYLRLDRWFSRSEAAFQLRLRILEERGECTAYALFRAARFEEAAEAARRCDRNLLKHVLVLAGRYREAAHFVSPGSELAAITAIADGRWTDAALYADEVAKDFDSRNPTEYVTKASLESRAAEARCIAAMFRAWGGDVKSVPAADHRNGCIAAHALAVPVEQRGPELALAMKQIDREREHSWFYKTAMLAAAYGANRIKLDLSDENKWFAPFAIATNPSAPADQRARWHARSALLDIERGDLAAAHRETQIALSLDDDEYAKRLPPILAVVETREHVEAESFEQLWDLSARARNGAPLDADDTLISPDTCQPRYAAAIDAARHGDGRPLAGVYRDCQVAERFPAVLFGVAPLIEKGRAELAEVLRLHRDVNADFAFPRHVLEQAWWYRELARMLGDTREYERWKAIYDRHAAMLGDREKLVALVMLHALSRY